MTLNRPDTADPAGELVETKWKLNAATRQRASLRQMGCFLAGLPFNRLVNVTFIPLLPRSGDVGVTQER
jgi:hypothetical protein